MLQLWIVKDCKILYKRIVNFFKKNGLETIEIKANKALKINKNLEINIVKFGYIDSALIVKSFNHKILNLNDSPLNKDSEIYKFKKKYGTFDTLLTQLVMLRGKEVKIIIIFVNKLL